MPHLLPSPGSRRATFIASAAFGLSVVAAGPLHAASAAGWLAPSTLGSTRDGGFASDADVATDDAGNAIATWVGTDATGGGRTLISERRSGGAWSPPTPVSAAGTAPAESEVAVNGRGDAVVAWNETGAGIRATFRSAGSSTWSADEIIAPSTEPEYGSNAGEASVAIDRDGRAVVAWPAPTREGPRIVTAAVRAPGGGWTVAADAAPDNGYEINEVELALDRSSNATVAWHEAGYSSTEPVGPFDQLKSRVLSPAGTWGPVGVIADDPANKLGLSLGVDAQGDASVAWHAVTYDFSSSPGTVVATKIATASRPAGGSWSAPTIHSQRPGYRVEPEIAVGAAGDVAVVWASQGEGAGPRAVYASTRTANGSWTAATPLGSQAEVDFPAVAVGANGRVVAMWREFVRGSWDQPRDFDVRAATRDAAGTWSPATTVASEVGSPIGFRPVFDEAGHALAVWNNWTREGSVYAVKTSTLDPVAPVLTGVTAPADGTAGVPVAFSASATDAWSTPTLSWAFGDGQVAAQAAPAHTFAKAGAYRVIVTATDGVGNTAAAERTVVIAAAATGPAPSPSPAATKPPAPSTPSTRRVAALLAGKVITLDRDVSLKQGKTTCPKPGALRVQVESRRKGKAPVQHRVTRRSLEVTRNGRSCTITGTLKLGTAPKKGTTARARVEANNIKQITLAVQRS